MQIVKKFLANGAIANLLNNTYLKARNAADSADIDVLKVNASDVIEFASFPQKSGTPANANDLVNKDYVDTNAGTGDIKSDGTVAFAADQSMGGFKLTNLAAPTVNTDAATKLYVDTAASAQKSWFQAALTLNGTDITNQYKDLSHVGVTGSIMLFVNGVFQRPGTDFTINYTGGSGGNTRITFAADLATGGAAELVSGDVLYFQYQIN